MWRVMWAPEMPKNREIKEHLRTDDTTAPEVLQTCMCEKAMMYVRIAQDSHLMPSSTWHFFCEMWKISDWLWSCPWVILETVSSGQFWYQKGGEGKDRQQRRMWCVTGLPMKRHAGWPPGYWLGSSRVSSIPSKRRLTATAFKLNGSVLTDWLAGTVAKYDHLTRGTKTTEGKREVGREASKLHLIDVHRNNNNNNHYSGSSTSSNSSAKIQETQKDLEPIPVMWLPHPVPLMETRTACLEATPAQKMCLFSGEGKKKNKHVDPGRK